MVIMSKDNWLEFIRKNKNFVKNFCEDETM